ncbi:MAG TPA: T9SS type A sorting domain-containing protein [Ignavibacteriaceae bacterium]|nr:T9SS type A sorting domain-containing protein [Ignavibacteriaceae bacterium]
MKQLYSFLFLILLLTISLKAQDGLGVWTTTTTGVGPVYAIVVDPSNTNIMYSGSLTLGVYKTTDAGGTWNPMNTGLTNSAVLSLAISASNPQVLYAGINVGSNDGVYKTTNGGGSWTRMVTGIQETGKGIQGVAVDPTNSNVAYIAVFDGVTDSPVGLYKTSDGGANWNPMTNGIGSIKNFLAVAVDPVNPNNVYAGTSFTVATSTGPSTIYKSTDAGASWTEINNGLPLDPTDINPVRTISVSPDDPNVVIAGLFVNSADLLGGLYVTTDGGGTWARKWDGAPQTVGTLLRSSAIKPGSPQEFYIGLDNASLTDIGVWGTTDGGDTWFSFNGGTMLNTYQIRALAFKGTSQPTLYAGAAANGAGIFEYTFQIIPVEFTSFTANTSGNNVSLNWSTATETNNAGFTVERKGIDGNWQTLGFITGNGNSTLINRYSFTDQNVAYGKYTYRLKQTDYNGSFNYSSEVSIEILAVNTFSLSQNYPNPFNPATMIKYSIPSDEYVTLKVFDVLGREAATLVNERQGSGEHMISFNASQLSSGVYFYSISAGTYKETRKMILAK